jgi:IS30 family transposase
MSFAEREEIAICRAYGYGVHEIAKRLDRSPSTISRELRATRPGRTAGWANSWSPEQIANRLPVDFPDDESIADLARAIYQALYIQGRGALKRELVTCLRTGRALRVPRARTRQRRNGFITPRS